MFETAVLSYGPPTKRFWATCAGFTGQALLIGFGVLAPMIWPEAIPRVAWASITLAPGPPPPPPPPPGPRVAPHKTAGASQIYRGIITLPTQIPNRPIQIVDEDPVTSSGPGGPGGVMGGVEGGVPGGILSSIMDQVRVTPVIPQPVVHEAPKANVTTGPVAKPPRISQLQLATPIHRVDPVYPALARQARISGTVELVGVLGVDGRIHELRVVRGHPLLIEAAITAVKQWIYAPTVLNGQAVEVQAPIQVNFILNR